MIVGESIWGCRGGDQRTIIGRSVQEDGAVTGPGRGRPAVAAFAVALLCFGPLPADPGAPGWKIGIPAAYALGGGGYRPDGPETPDKSEAVSPKEEKEEAVLGTPLPDLPPAAEIDPKGVSPDIANLLRYGAVAGTLEPVYYTEPAAVNTVGPIRSAAGAPWVVEPKRPPEDIIVVEGETSQFNQTVNMSEWLDYFFNDERLEDEINYTRLRIRGEAFFKEDEAVEFDQDVDFKLSVPGLERRMVLFFNGDPGDGFEDGEEGEDRLDPEEEENALLGLQTFFNATRKLNISVRGGVRFRDGSPVLFAGPRYRRLINLDPWALRLTAETRWYTDEGLATRGYMDFERKFSEDLFLRLTPGASWAEEDENLKYQLNARLFHRLSNKSVLRYSAFAKFDTDTKDSLVNARIRVAYRQKIIRDWLVVELVPQITFPAERDYNPTWGVRLRLETTFDIHMPWWND